MTIEQYIDNLYKRYKLGNATEYTLRGDLEQLIESLVPTIRATNEPKRQSGGSPDYILTKKEIPVEFIEAKDIDEEDTFLQLVKLGGEIRQIQLESLTVERYITQYPVEGDNVVHNVRFDLPLPLQRRGYFLPFGEGRGGVKLPGYVTANPYTYGTIKHFRADLKKNPTKAEIILWEYLRNKKTGFKIRRQHVIADFIVDFVCLTKKTVIEVDGKIHDFQKDKDAARTVVLNMKGFEVIRFSNEEVLENPQQVADSIKLTLESTTDKGSGEVGRIYINPTQYFDNVPQTAWNFYIGGYQPAQKWLKDRKERKLGFDDILHYQKIIVALSEADRIMKEIDKIEIE